MPSGRMTSKADRRSDATSSSASPRSKISRTLPEARCGNGTWVNVVTASAGRERAMAEELNDTGESPCGGARDSNANFVVSVPARRNDGRAAWRTKGRVEIGLRADFEWWDRGLRRPAEDGRWTRGAGGGKRALHDGGGGLPFAPCSFASPSSSPVRTLPFHGKNRGSNPRGDANFLTRRS